MKKLIALFLILIMIFCFTACKDKDDVRGDISSGGNSNTDNSDVVNSDNSNSTNVEEAKFDIGKVNSNTYKNKFLGISCKLGSDWTFMSDEQIKETNKQALNLMDEDYTKALQNASTFTDMMATHSNQTDTLGITFEKLTGANLTMSEDKYVDSTKDSLKSGLESMGMQNVTLTTGKGDFAGKKHPYVAISASYSSISVYEKLYIVKKENYIAVIAACTWKTNGCDSILNLFEAAK